ncbi:MAG: transglutaminase-like domain-containing protein [Bacteroidales bacterium]|nr:transglutaminase-like domain-containing protein [Bacteroidales bacterium]
MNKNKVLTLCWMIFLSSCSPFFRVINYKPSNRVSEINFLDKQITQAYRFYYSDTLGNKYLRELRKNYGLDTLTLNLPNEIEKIKTILHWSSSKWKHNGFNTPSKSDALTILKEASAGKQFRCVEYGILAASSLNSIGIHARVLGLKTRDVEKVKRGAGHVVAEVYSQEYSKWIFIDPQFDVLPTLKGIPLNAVEFQKAILIQKQDIELVNSEGKVDSDFSKKYINWIGKYLYFFDIKFDQRNDFDVDEKDYNGKTSLMLVPTGVDNPLVFQRKYKIDNCIYTNFVNDFYIKPN